jgi:TRAP-type C4-dicarboxylate transport system permease small subunit
VVDEEGDWKDYAPEDWAAFVFFWALAILVFLQFFTRYVLNNSLSWTEEIAQYCLIACTFVGGATATRKSSHIVVEFLYVYLPARVAFALSTLTDLMCIGFYAVCVWLSWKVMLIMHHQPMIAVEWPLSIVYGAVTAGFAAMTFRECRVSWRNFHEGRSALILFGQEVRQA